MDLSREPSVPPNLNFVVLGLVWPSPAALQAQTVRPDIELQNESMVWIKRILKSSWTAPDLSDRLQAGRAIIAGQDAFLARYALDETKIQIAVTKYHVHIVIKPSAGMAPLQALHEYLQVDQPSDKAPWTGEPWKTAPIDGLIFGYQMKNHLMSWRDSLNYLTNGRAIKFSAQKVATLPEGSGPPKTAAAPTIDSERAWFTN